MKEGRKKVKNNNNKKESVQNTEKVRIFENAWFSRRVVSSFRFSDTWGEESYSSFKHNQLSFTAKKTNLQVNCK